MIAPTVMTEDNDDSSRAKRFQEGKERFHSFILFATSLNYYFVLQYLTYKTPKYLAKLF